jgi:hypothetical protein
MFDKYTLRGSIWKQQVNTVLGTLFLSVVALWASLVMISAGWGENPLATAFAATVARETVLP